VAGLVPGAHQGRGLGNKFLDDLRHADGLVHVVDVSGTTDAEGLLPETDIVMPDLSFLFLIGKATRGYDPSQDIIWLRSEIVRWILGNLMEKWYFSVISNAI
jgi:ribosome-binding ATPase